MSGFQEKDLGYSFLDGELQLSKSECVFEARSHPNDLLPHQHAESFNSFAEPPSRFWQWLKFAAFLSAMGLASVCLLAGPEVHHDIKLKNGSPSQVVHKTPDSNRCTTKGCVALAAIVQKNLDQTQDPCEKFYQFANGGWVKSHPLPSGESVIGAFTILERENANIVREILQSDKPPISSPSSHDTKVVEKLRRFFRSCMDEAEMNKLGNKPLLTVVQNLRKIFRGERKLSSVFEEGEEKELCGTEVGGAEAGSGVNKGNLTAALAFVQSRGARALFDLFPDGDIGQDPDQMVVWIGDPELGLPSKEYYSEENAVKAYAKALKRILLDLDDTRKRGTSGRARRLDDQRSSARVERLANKVVEFEKKIVNATLDAEVIHGNPFKTYHPTSSTDFAQSLPQFHLPQFLSTFGVRTAPQRVILKNTGLPGALSAILKDTDEDVVESYLVVRMALWFAQDLGKNTEVKKAVNDMRDEVEGESVRAGLPRPRPSSKIRRGGIWDWEREREEDQKEDPEERARQRAANCAVGVENVMGFATGRYFVQRAFAEESKTKCTNIVQHIKTAFKHTLGKVPWMDKKSSEAAVKKADSVRVKIGYPSSPNTSDATSIFKYYQDVKVNEKTLFNNMASAHMSTNKKLWKQVGRKKDREEWGMNPSAVNGYYDPQNNEIVFPAGILRPPFFSSEWPSYFMLGSFGMVAAHELVHAFDTNGRFFNLKGKLERWWTETTSAEYDKRATCIGEQYSHYTIDNGKGGKAHVNGNLTLGENIGDTGLFLAYRAWKALEPTSFTTGADGLLPGLNYTREQLFFIAFAQLWANVKTTGAALQALRTDPHSPPRFRVEGTLYNMPEFAQAFNCSRTAKMNPPKEKQCKLW